MLRAKYTILTAVFFINVTVFANSLTVEELRIESAKKVIPDTVTLFSENVDDFTSHWKKAVNFNEATHIVREYSHQLWQIAKKQILANKRVDDRPLYWARLMSSKTMRITKPAFDISEIQLSILLKELEQGSRGRTELAFTQDTNKKILLTGFDPFLLDRNINQSNPSGIAALLLDGQVIEYKGIRAEINTVIVPVRYEDFDQGIIEDLLAPYYALNNVDMIVTVSMGRKEFDLERFPGKRRSVTAPDNLNILSGGTQEKPVIPKLHQRALPGEEFVLFSLPIAAMQKAEGDYKVIDNHQVTSISISGKPITFKPEILNNISEHIAVNGSGGGYLSNEISYRSIRLRDQLNSTIPTGHIHTPRIQQYDAEIETNIVEQIRAMLEQALVTL